VPVLFSVVLIGFAFCLGRFWPDVSRQDSVPLAQRETRPGPGQVEQDKALLVLLDAGREASGSAVYNLEIFNRYSAIWRKHGKGGRSPSILEIGPGTSLAQGVLFVASGARKYTGLDLYTYSELYRPYGYTAAYGMLSLVAPASVRLKADEIYSISGDKVVFNPSRIEYLFPRQSYDIRLPDGSVDFVFSHSVFEHISDPARTIAAIGKVLRQGGLSAHHFDMRDHTDFSKPLEFLKMDERAWAARHTGNRSHLYTNRKRLSDFVKMFESAGFKVRKVEPTSTVPMSEEIRRGFDAEFQKYDLEDLAVVSALIVAEKP
jgi:SAM-dependent methyltransferase